MAGKRKRNTDVSLRLAQQVLLDEEYKDSNIVLFPLSIMALLGLLAAVSEGAKLGQFLHFLDWETVEDINSFSSKQFDVFSRKGDRGGALLNLVSGVWVDQSLVIKSSFKQIVNNVHQVATLIKKAYFQSKVGSDSENLASNDDNVMLIAPNNFMTWHLFPVSGNGSGEGSENNSAQQPPQVKKSRRGPRSRSSQYRGVTFYRRIGIWESHIWNCGKKVYLGKNVTA